MTKESVSQKDPPRVIVYRGSFSATHQPGPLSAASASQLCEMLRAASMNTAVSQNRTVGARRNSEALYMFLCVYAVLAFLANMSDKAWTYSRAVRSEALLNEG